MIKRVLFFILILVILAGCSNPTTEVKGAKGDTITINHFVFEPKELTVVEGTTVTWLHNDNVAHTIVSPSLFESSVLNKGDKFTFTFTKKGEYEYYCSIHPSMRGKIIVS